MFFVISVSRKLSYFCERKSKSSTMQMYQFFWCGVEIDDFLFKGNNISGWKGMLVACIGTALLAFLLFTVTFCKEMFHSSVSAQQQGQAFVGDRQIFQVWTSSWKTHAFQTVTSFIQITLGYFVMLIVMSFNVYLVLAVAIGSTSGFFALNPLLLKKRSIFRPPQRLVQCQAEECGSLIEGQERIETVRGRNQTGNNDPSEQLIISANIHQHAN
ncbi:uncharacterized protein LOC116924874 [Daphnia magna]|uniref:uncharacterized protein LOC116924874 n=1 Tax=Daphnia magna TaxID=35525 RepID=UPI001E1BBDB1|nr:uncharacterized protein LOC116924874 [Daphnia magna]